MFLFLPISNRNYLFMTNQTFMTFVNQKFPINNAKTPSKCNKSTQKHCPGYSLQNISEIIKNWPFHIFTKATTEVQQINNTNKAADSKLPHKCSFAFWWISIINFMHFQRLWIMWRCWNRSKKMEFLIRISWIFLLFIMA